jgi:hypothetical protein
MALPRIYNPVSLSEEPVPEVVGARAPPRSSTIRKTPRRCQQGFSHFPIIEGGRGGSAWPRAQKAKPSNSNPITP